MTPHVLRAILTGHNPGFPNWFVAIIPQDSPLPIFFPGLVSRFEPLVAKLKLSLFVSNSRPFCQLGFTSRVRTSECTEYILYTAPSPR